MIVNSTEVQNNFGKYLLMTLKEDIIITKNGEKVAKLSAIDNDSPEGDPILSQSTGGKDLLKKMDLYMESGVKEYWVVNPITREVSVYMLDKETVNDNITFGLANGLKSAAASFIFKGLTVDLNSIFME